MCCLRTRCYGLDNKARGSALSQPWLLPLPPPLPPENPQKTKTLTHTTVMAMGYILGKVRILSSDISQHSVHKQHTPS